ncbi:MAG: hypothetical protein D6767_00395 [Candidatus Hydrogenedentota bacterium]|nr:MAG: hypothetical protein D6767_00395 [Candidatus Hydrogenedentota bacterium]
MIRWLPAVLLFLLSCSRLLPPKRPDVPASNVLVATTTDFTTGFLSVMDLSTYKVYSAIEPIHSDAVVRYENGSFFVINRLGADNIEKLIPQTSFYPAYEVSVSSKANPQDIAIVSNTLAAISLYGKNYLLWVNPETGQEVGRTDLSSFADDDGLPEASGLIYEAGKIFLTAQRLNRNTSGYWLPVGTSYLLEISPITKSVETAYPLPFANPVSDIVSDGTSLYMAAPATFAASFTADGGIVQLDLATRSFQTSPLTETQTGYEISDLCFSNNKLFLLGLASDYSSILAVFDRNTQSLSTLKTIPSSEGGFFSGLICDSLHVYVGDRTITNPGVRIIDSATNAVGNPISLGLPPFSIAIIP